MSMGAVFGLVLIYCSLGLCYRAITAVLSITFQHYTTLLFFISDLFKSCLRILVISPHPVSNSFYKAYEVDFFVELL